VLCCANRTDIGAGGTVVAGKIHATLRNLDVSLGGKLSCGSRQRHRRHWIVPTTSGRVAHGLSLTATGLIAGRTIPVPPATRSCGLECKSPPGTAATLSELLLEKLENLYSQRWR
jgi:hypothetical protein